MRMKFIATLCAAMVGLLAWSHSAVAQQKTAKQCNDEWTANKASIQASGKTKKDFVADCRGVTTAASKTPVALANGQYATEAEAKASCPTDAVVWVNLTSKVYHASGSRSYGKTKRGGYMCEKDSIAGGFRAPKTAKRVTT